MAKSPIKRTLQRTLTLLNPTASTALSGAAGPPHALGGGGTRWAHLVERYPEVHDGLERLAMVAAARGDHARAAEYDRKAADFVHDHADCCDREMEIYMREAAEFGTPSE